MKRIMMTKYGFERCAEDDFADDGNLFQGFRVGRVRVTKLVTAGEAYINASIDGRKLPFEVYSSLPHYLALGALNGIKLVDISDKDLFDLYNACIAYEQEYKEAENNIVMPTADDIIRQCVKVSCKILKEIEELTDMVTNNINTLLMNASDDDWKWIKKYINNLQSKLENYDTTTYVPRIINTRSSINFCKPDCDELKPSFYYEQAMKLINKSL